MKPLCVECGKNPQWGPWHVPSGYDPELCEECNIRMQLEGRSGIDETDSLCVRCGTKPRLKGRCTGDDSTLCADCTREVRAKHSLPIRRDEYYCPQCLKRPRESIGKAKGSVLCPVCSALTRIKRDCIVANSTGGLRIRSGQLVFWKEESTPDTPRRRRTLQPLTLPNRKTRMLVMEQFSLFGREVRLSFVQVNVTENETEEVALHRER